MTIVSLQLSPISGTAQAPLQVKPSLEEISTRVNQAVRQAARDHSLSVDPQIVAEIVAEAGLFAGSFCFSVQSTTNANPCQLTVYDANALRAAIGDFLKDAARHPSTIETLASRLARLAGRKLSDAGWPTHVDNNFGGLEVPRELRNATFEIRTAKGNSQLGGPANAILMKAGVHVLIATLSDGRKVSGSVEVQPRKLGTWRATVPAETSSLGRIGVHVQHFCSSAPTTLPHEPLTRFNSGRSTLAETTASREAHIVHAASQAGLDIALRDESRSCDSQCLTGIGIAFAEAIAVWRSGCERCDGNALSVLRIGGNVWVDSRAAARLRDLVPSAIANPDLSLANSRPDEIRRFISAPSLSVPRSLMVGYEQINNDANLVHTLCTLNHTSDNTWVSSAQGFLCPGVHKPSFALSPTVTIKESWTNCGPKAIACGIPGGEVQITVKDTAYRIDGPSGPMILGKPSANLSVDVRPVILHEVGHWFGLPHPEAVGVPVFDIMSGVFDPERKCVTAESLTMLNNAIDDRWPYRAKTIQGLLRPKAVHVRGGKSSSLR